MAGEGSPSDDSFAAKLNQLFATIRSPGGKEYTPEQVAAWVRANGGPSISASYIYMLRRGERDNPTRSHLTALAGFFEVPAAYFFDDALSRQIGDELQLLTALRDSDTRFVALRTSELTDDARRSIAAIVREMGSWARRDRDAGAGKELPDETPDESGTDVEPRE